MRRLTGFVAVCAVLAVVSGLGAQERERDGVTLPVPIKEVRAEHTEAAKAARIQGTVVLEAVVLVDGTVGDVTVTRSLDTETGLDAEAVKALKQWRWRPGTKNGEPVPVVVAVEMTFTLK